MTLPADDFACAGPVAAFPENSGRRVLVHGRALAVFRVGEAWYACKDACPHQDDMLSVSRPEGTQIQCKGHNWRFDLRSGACLSGRVGKELTRYPVELRGDQVFVGKRRLREEVRGVD